MAISDYPTWQAALAETQDDVDEAVARLHRHPAEPSGPQPSESRRREVPAEGIAMLRDLVATERDPGRFSELLVTWAADVTGAIAQGEFGVAAAWLNAVLVAPGHPAEFSARVDAAFDTLSRPEALDDLLVRLGAADPGRGGPELVAAWGARLVGYMIDLMVVDDPPVSRRRLIEFLGWAGRSDVRLLAAHTRDSRWFVVRNLAIALGKTGRATAVPVLEHLVAHPEPRVRVEVLRAMALLDPDGTLQRVAAGLEDRSSRVRHAALTLLRANPGPAVVPVLAAAARSGGIDADQARRLVGAIAERRHGGVIEALGTVAGRRFAVGTTRAARDAARAALARLQPR